MSGIRNIDITRCLTSLPLDFAQATSTPRLPTPPKGKEWQVILAYHDLVAEEKYKKQQEDLKLKNELFKKSFDEHVNMKKSRP